MSSKSHPITPKVFHKPHAYEVYLPHGAGPFPVIFQTPILGRFALLPDLFFERRFARFFAEQGLACVLVDRPIFEFDSSRGLEQIQEYLEESLKRNQAVMESLFPIKSLDSNRMGSFGMSFGAIINILWAAREKRLSSHAFCLPGGDLPGIFMASQDPLMTSYRKAALACCGNDPKALHHSLQKIFTMDPLFVAEALPSNQILLILGLLDRVVPLRYGKALEEKMPGHETILLPLGHYFSMLASPFVKWWVVKFFKKKFYGTPS